jgi:hypothetical protein
MANVYGYRSGRSVKNVSPQAVGETLERLRAESGQLTAGGVLEAARNPESPLHPAFEWDDEAAAEQYRLSQARRLIVSVRILNGPARSTTPVYVSVRTPEKGRNYVPTIEALSDEQLRARVLADVEQFAESMQRRYAAFRDLAEVLDRLRQAAS